jgi:hypothetical protein
MAQIIYQKDSTALIPQGNRTVSTFPSGLVKVDQSFIGRTSLESSHRHQFAIGNSFITENDPSIDGLSIFPSIQEKRMPNGFTEYIVTAYGRTNMTGISYIVPGQKLISRFRWKYRGYNEIYFSSGIFRSYEMIRTRVIKENDLDENDPLVIPSPVWLSDNALRDGSIRWDILDLRATLIVETKDIKRTNFGKFTELTILSGYSENTAAFI